MPKPGIPESFKVLIKELQSLCLDVRVLDSNEQEIDLKQTFEEDDEIIPQPVSDEEFTEDVIDEGDLDEGYSMENSDDEFEDIDSDAMNDEDLFNFDDDGI